MDRETALKYVGHAVDDALSPRSPEEAPPNARLVGWQCGFEPMFVAVWSYLPGCRVDAAEAENIAGDYLAEMGWFGEGAQTEEDGTKCFPPADYIL